MTECSLIEARLTRRMTQEELEAASGVPQSTISALESGQRRSPTIQTVRRLEAALGVRLVFRDWLDETERPPGS